MHTLGSPAGFVARITYGLRAGWATGFGNAEGDQVGVRWNVRTGEATAFPTTEMARQAAAAGLVVGYDQAGYAVIATEPGFAAPARPDAAGGRDRQHRERGHDDGRTIAGQAVLGGADRTIGAGAVDVHLTLRPFMDLG